MTDTNAPSPASWAHADSFAPEVDAAAGARRSAGELGGEPLTAGAATLLTILASTLRARNVVELGTNGGVAGLALFAGMAPDGVLTSIDPETQQQSAARATFRAAGIAPQRFRLINGRPLDILPNLRDAAYDLVLVDGDKLEYVEYVEQATRLLRRGGLLVLSHALWHDRVADTDNEDDETVIIREALESVRANEDFTTTLVPAGDGLLLAIKA